MLDGKAHAVLYAKENLVIKALLCLHAALFPNPDRELLSGSIGNVILQNPKTEAVTIPMTATVELQDKIIAYRLKNGQAEAAYLTVDRLNDGNRFIVKEGLSVGDTIVAEGVGLVREGMSITPKNETK